MPLLNHLKAGGAAAGDPVYYFRGLTASYPDSVQTELGVGPTPIPEQNKPVYKLEDLLSKGALIRLRVTYASGGASKSARLVCLRSKLATALDGLIGKDYKTGLIISVNIPLKDTFY